MAAQTQRILGSFQSKYCMWDEAVSVYRNAWNEGMVCITPIPGGHFDMPRARPLIHSMTIVDSDSDEEGPSGSANNTDSNEEEFRVLFGSLTVWFVFCLPTLLIHQLISTCRDCWECK
jgi:hypothetical protein